MEQVIRIQVQTAAGREHCLWALKGKNLWEVLTTAGFHPAGDCGGHGTCGKCKVLVEGDVTAMDESERLGLLPDELNRGLRLACRCRVMGPVSVAWLEDAPSSAGHMPITAGKSEANRASCQRVLLPGLDPEMPQPIHHRLKIALGGAELALPLQNLERLSRMDRQGRPSLELTALKLDDRVLAVERHRPPVFGLALDLGSTSLFAALIDLSTGKIEAVASQSNMQRVYGADVISRISYCTEHENGLQLLHQVLINNVNGMIDDLLKSVHARSEDIYETVVVGNPVMLHLFLHLSVAGFASAPYQGLFIDEMTLPHHLTGLNVNSCGHLVVIPQAGGFVGADIVAGLLTVPERSRARFVFIDIGTNGEVVVGNQGHFWAASAAAGPALEGGELQCGMRAAEGAVDRVEWDHERGFIYSVIGDTVPKGICGSAVIDITAALLKAGWIDSYGTITDAARQTAPLQRGRQGEQFVLASPGTPAESAVTFSQDDIRQVQLAKSALRTTIDLLLEKSGMKIGDIQSMYLAGAFGHFLDPGNLIAIGLLPPVSKDIVHSLGNAAVAGAVKVLVSKKDREEAGQIQKRITLVELAGQAAFQDGFLRNMNFEN